MPKRRLTKALDRRLSEAIAFFWRTRTKQDAGQGVVTGRRDYGNRTAATGGKQLDAINLLIAQLLAEAGVPRECIHLIGRENVTLPGYFRPTKLWDLIVVFQDALLAAFEAKALCGPSFGNNYNNRIEEALGSSVDIWTAYREGAFSNSPEPFVGYFLLLEEHPRSITPVSVKEKHFHAFEEFRSVSYEVRCEHSVRRMVRERCYNGAAFIVSPKESGKRGGFREPAEDLSFERFVKMMCGHVMANYRALQ
ncbi:MAG: PaeR7I family type II restriction endonuclease [Pirellulales bacterium]